VCETSFSDQNCYFIESLDASLSFFSSGAARVVEVGCFFAGEPAFFFSLSSSKNYKFVLFCLIISTLILILLIFNFFCPFIKKFIYF